MNAVYRFSTWSIAKIVRMDIVLRSQFPATSFLHKTLPGNYFVDSFERFNVDIQDQSALKIFLHMTSQSSFMANFLLRIRNKFVSQFGLKDVGTMASTVDPNKPLESYKIGDKLSIFTIVHISPDEIVVEDNDKHLHVQVSLQKFPETNSVVANSVVHVHNIWGKIYMFFVAPVHSVLAPLLLVSLKELESQQHVKIENKVV